ncbi:MAG: hypothetical protein GY821_05300 [Gammaproteobacteria bacterium]|nr:hypothetical protein [Gammaproteobacteria bacterium]MCP4473976.1 hypothetical protein [Gammaproteobacteria bacterium]
MDLKTGKQAKLFPSDLALATTLLIIWLLDKPLATIVSRLKIDEQDLVNGMSGKTNPLKRFLMLYMNILRKSSKALDLQEQRDEVKFLISEAKDLSLELEKRNIRLSLPLDLNYLEVLING